MPQSYVLRNSRLAPKTKVGCSEANNNAQAIAKAESAESLRFMHGAIEG